jgi:ubiquinone/menaquinone biosynthesis C-methylase UbiE
MPNNQPKNSSHSERVRDLFNKRATAWSELYRENQKLVWRLEEFYTNLAKHVPQPANVLDFGCGAGNLATCLYVHGYQVTACDIAENMIAEARQTFAATSIEWVNLPTEWRRLPFADNAFDGVIASSVFEYLEDLDLAFGELARVLRPGGVLVFSVPNMEHRERKFEQWINHLAVGRWIHGLARSIPQVRNYLDYLRLSRNRFLPAVWEERAAVYKFHSCGGVSDLSLERPLLLLSLQKIP